MSAYWENIVLSVVLHQLGHPKKVRVPSSTFSMKVAVGGNIKTTVQDEGYVYGVPGLANSVGH